MGITSINEPDGPGHTWMLTPMSVNEPLTGENVPAPVITALEPPNCVSGDPDFMLVVRGDNFLPVSVIVFASHDEPTTWNGDGSLQTVVRPSLFAPAVVDVEVRTAQNTSGAVTFSFDAPP